MTEQVLETYENELRAILQTWVFSFPCSNCMITELSSTFKFISKEYKGNDSLGIFPEPPMVVCGCNENLYSIKSHGLYDLFETLYNKDANGLILVRSRIEAPTEEEEPGYDLLDQ